MRCPMICRQEATWKWKSRDALCTVSTYFGRMEDWYRVYVVNASGSGCSLVICNWFMAYSVVEGVFGITFMREMICVVEPD